MLAFDFVLVSIRLDVTVLSIKVQFKASILDACYFLVGNCWRRRRREVHAPAESSETTKQGGGVEGTLVVEGMNPAGGMGPCSTCGAATMIQHNLMI